MADKTGKGKLLVVNLAIEATSQNKAYKFTHRNIKTFKMVNDPKYGNI